MLQNVVAPGRFKSLGIFFLVFALVVPARGADRMHRFLITHNGTGGSVSQSWTMWLKKEEGSIGEYCGQLNDGRYRAVGFRDGATLLTGVFGTGLLALGLGFWFNTQQVMSPQQQHRVGIGLLVGVGCSAVASYCFNRRVQATRAQAECVMSIEADTKEEGATVHKGLWTWSPNELLKTKDPAALQSSVASKLQAQVIHFEPDLGERLSWMSRVSSWIWDKQGSVSDRRGEYQVRCNNKNALCMAPYEVRWNCFHTWLDPIRQDLAVLAVNTNGLRKAVDALAVGAEHVKLQVAEARQQINRLWADYRALEREQRRQETPVQ